MRVPELSIRTDSHPDDGKTWATHNRRIESFVWSMVIKGMQACLHPFREGARVKIGEKTQPLEEVIATWHAEDSLNHIDGADQRIWYPGHRLDEESQPATTARRSVRAPQEHAPNAAGTFSPRFYFGWFILLAASTAVIVVLLVWIIAVMVF